MALYDRKRLVEDADGFTVASYIGMDIMTKGSKSWILCPGHEKRLGKKDSKMSNAHLTKYGYKCYACGESVNVFNMVMEYYESEYGQELNIQEAMGIVGDALGGRDLYIVNGDANHQSTRIVNTLSSEDYEILGIKQNLYYDRIVNCGYDPEEAKENGLSFKKADDYEQSHLYIYYKREHIALSKLASDEPNIYKKLIKTCAKKMKAKYDSAINLYCDKNAEKVNFLSLFSKDGIIDDELIYQVKQTLVEKLNRINEILIEFDDNEVSNDEHEKKKEKKDFLALFG